MKICVFLAVRDFASLLVSYLHPLVTVGWGEFYYRYNFACIPPESWLSLCATADAATEPCIHLPDNLFDCLAFAP